MTFWKKIKDLFQESEQSSPHQPVIHQLIQRDTTSIQVFDSWKNQLVKKRLFNWISEQYIIFQSTPKDIDQAIDFLNTPSSKGFVIHFYKTNYTNQEGQFVLDYLKERVLDLPYTTQVSDTRTYNRPKWVETTERHYLKPNPNFDEQNQFNQQFGNIKIELILRNDRIYYLKFSATTYQDRLYADADRFEKLIQHVLE